MLTRSDLIRLYENAVGPMDHQAMEMFDAGKRAKGGYLRAKKGKLVEDLARHAVEIAWLEAGGHRSRLSFGDKKTFRIDIRPGYVKSLPSEIQAYVERRITEHYYNARVDVKAFVDGEFVLAIECKSFTENAMLKRILVDFRMLLTLYPDLPCCLFQLESQLGGSYSDPLANPQFGSPSSHTLMSHFPDVALNIITLLEGERHPKRPIHDPDYYKALRRPCLDHAIGNLTVLLRPFV